MNVITVSPVQGGWVVDHALAHNPMMFLAGGKAERKARQLAEQATQRGQTAEVWIYDIAGRLAGRFQYAADPSLA